MALRVITAAALVGLAVQAELGPDLAPTGPGSNTKLSDPCPFMSEEALDDQNSDEPFDRIVQRAQKLIQVMDIDASSCQDYFPPSLQPEFLTFVRNFRSEHPEITGDINEALMEIALHPNTEVNFDTLQLVPACRVAYDLLYELAVLLNEIPLDISFEHVLASPQEEIEHLIEIHKCRVSHEDRLTIPSQSQLHSLLISPRARESFLDLIAELENSKPFELLEEDVPISTEKDSVLEMPASHNPQMFTETCDSVEIPVAA